MDSVSVRPWFIQPIKGHLGPEGPDFGARGGRHFRCAEQKHVKYLIHGFLPEMW